MAGGKYCSNFDKLFNYSRDMCKVIGIDVISLDFKPSWRTLCTFVVAIIGFLLCFYTMYVDAVVNGNYTYIFKSGCIAGSALQGIAKAVTALCQKSGFRFLYAEIKQMYVTCELELDTYEEVLKASISLIKKLYFITLSIISVTCFIIILLPLVMWYIFGTRYEILPFIIPFVDYDSDFGFYFTSGFQIICVVLSCFGNFIGDSWLFMYVAHVQLMKDILKSKFDALDEIVKKHPKDISKSFRLLHDIFVWHQKYNTYRNTIKNTFFWIIFVQISSEFFGTAFTIVCMFLGIWPAAPMYAIYLYSLLLSYCSLGNLVESANDDVCKMIYDCCWYHLTVSEQKMILIMLRDSQNSSSLSIGGVAPLSLNTALQLTKTIYTISMMLKEYFN